MTNISDETLMAFLDGELEAAQAEAVRSQLSKDEAMRNRLRHMKEVDELLQASFKAELAVPARFNALLSASGGDATNNVVPLRPKQKFSIKNLIPTGAGIAAAVLVLMTGGVWTPAQIGWLEKVDDGLAVTGTVQAAITRTPSGKRVTADGLDVVPVLSFVSGDGHLCREVYVHEKELSARMIACRDTDEDEWCVEAFTRIPTQTRPDAYHTAGFDKDPVIEAAYARLKIQSTLDANGEKAAIASNWVKR